MSAVPRCPCGGQVWCDPTLGLLAHHDGECWIGRAEAEQLADDRVACGTVTSQAPRRGFNDPRRLGRVFARAITDAEIALLIACGVEPATAARAQVGVLFVGGGAIRRRTFSSVTVSLLPGMPSRDPRLVA